MPTSLEDQDFAELERAIEAIVRHQMAWHLKHNSTGDKERLLQIGARHVVEKLELMMHRYDDQGRRDVADVLDGIQAELLPAIIQRLRAR